MPYPKIAIIGAGPAGLLLARLLQINEIAYTVFEVRSQESDADQGGTLDLHPQGGQKALARAGLLEEFRKLSRPEGEADKLVKYDGTVLWDENVTGILRPADETDRPEIGRAALRSMLLKSVDERRIQWEKKLLEVRPSESAKEKYDLHFTDGSVESDFDLVVGADGAWSRVRPLVTEEKPFYSGISAVEMRALDAREKKPWLSKYVGEGSMFMFDEGRAIMCQRQGDGSIRTYAAVRQPETWVKDCEIDWSKEGSARKAVVDKHFANVGEELKRVVFESDDKLTPWTLWMLPVGLTWQSRSGITLMGDAAHLMTPFAGVGVNLALVDGLELGTALTARKEAFAAGSQPTAGLVLEAIQEYEASMLKRSGIYAQKTYEGMQGHFSADGGEKRAARFRQHVERMQKSKK